MCTARALHACNAAIPPAGTVVNFCWSFDFFACLITKIKPYLMDFVLGWVTVKTLHVVNFSFSKIVKVI